MQTCLAGDFGPADAPNAPGNRVEPVTDEEDGSDEPVPLEDGTLESDAAKANADKKEKAGTVLGTALYIASSRSQPHAGALAALSHAPAFTLTRPAS